MRIVINLAQTPEMEAIIEEASRANDGTNVSSTHSLALLEDVFRSALYLAVRAIQQDQIPDVYPLSHDSIDEGFSGGAGKVWIDGEGWSQQDRALTAEINKRQVTPRKSWELEDDE